MNKSTSLAISARPPKLQKPLVLWPLKHRPKKKPQPRPKQLRLPF